MRKNTLKAKMQQKIKRSKRFVFLRSDFRKLAGYDQVGRALKLLVAEGKLIKLGYGLYGKARFNALTKEPMLDSDYGFAQIAKEALNRLGVAWESSEAMESYEQGSLQIPTRFEVKIFDRFCRKIGTNSGFKLLTVKG